MVPAQPKFLLLCGLFALPTAVCAAGCLPLGAAIAGAGVLFAVLARTPYRLAGLAALPTLLAALPLRVDAPAYPRPGPVRVCGRLVETIRNPERDSMWLRLAAGEHRLGLGCSGPIDAVPGDRIEAIANLTAASIPGLPPTLQATPGSIKVHAAAPSLPRLLQSARAACEQELLQLLPDERGAILATLVLGRGTRTPTDIAEAHRATGLSHLLAVSGAHAAMLCLLLGLGGAGRGRRLRASRRHLMVALLLLFAYAGITGCEPPVVRAVLMYSLAAIAVQVGRRLSLFAGLMVPALVTACTEPQALLGPSFLLSYA
ncbi:MAG: ComEC/Rec2 family competence protein, partial [Planctomycetes bacterium]|nr:ComEC/Rec2 family competence protein [Planctomycetota bacterium]